ncbi:MAG: DUF4914 family protein, partial [Planctomycetota bacterium]
MPFFTLPHELPSDVEHILNVASTVHFFDSTEKMFEKACGTKENDFFEVAYELPDGRRVVEATVARVRNGIVVNYPEPYMRRRDPNCMLIADDKPTDKPRFRERFGTPFDELRQATLDWLSEQELAVFSFRTGRMGMGEDAMAVCPANAAFFALGLAMLQGIIPYSEVPENFKP